MALPTRELALDVTATVIVAALSPRLPHALAVGDLLLAGAVVLLLQGLVRDLWSVASVARAARASASGEPVTREVTCVCVESTVGVTAIVAGLALTLGWQSGAVHLPPVAWPIGFASVLLFGTGVRNLVFDWRARSLRREPDHRARVTWRGGSSKHAS
jgi:hypothetical protein